MFLSGRREFCEHGKNRPRKNFSAIIFWFPYRRSNIDERQLLHPETVITQEKEKN